MTFNVNTDVNYAEYLTLSGPLDAYTKSQFDAFVIKQFANQATAGATLSSGSGFTTLLTAALQSAKAGNYEF